MRRSPDEPERRCAICGRGGCTDLGPILHPLPTQVGGVLIDLPGDYRLKRCGRCGFQFKDPPIAADRLLACYAEAESSHWGETVDPRERRFDVIAELLGRHAPGRRVLDIGCFNGALLEHLGSAWERYGVEPSRKAVATAKQRGVRIVGRTLDDVPGEVGAFDAILAIDVVEHIAEPVGFFRGVWERLGPNGIFLAVTGDTGALTWRMQGSRYWYCSIPEHVSFYCQSTMAYLEREMGMERVEYERHSHIRSRIGPKSVELAKNLIYTVGNRLKGLGVRRFQRTFVERRAPGWMTARDHMFYVMKRR